MLIVYQSLESTKVFADVPWTFITGNSFKRNVHDSIRNGTGFDKSRSWDETNKTVAFDTTRSATKFATRGESEHLSSTISGYDPPKKLQTAIKILAKIVERIVDNTTACTRPPNSVCPHVRFPDVIVLGEIYASGLKGQVLELPHLETNYVVVGGIDPTSDARHRFTVLMKAGFDGKRPDPNYDASVEPFFSVEQDKDNKDEDAKCMLVKVRGWLVAFVHTPNEICNKPKRAAQYLHNNALMFGEGSRLDLVMGDTNQTKSDAVRAYMNRDYNTLVGKTRRIVKAPRSSKPTKQEVDVSMKEEASEEEAMEEEASEEEASEAEAVDAWEHSVMSDGKQVIRGYTNYLVAGTNSNYKTQFDIACTPEASIRLSGVNVKLTEEDELTYECPKETEHNPAEPAFMFHGLTDKFFEWDDKLYAYSDHNGVIVEILRDKPEHRSALKRARRESAVNDLESNKRRVIDEPTVEDFQSSKHLMIEWTKREGGSQ